MKKIKNFFSIKKVFLLLSIITIGTTTLFAAGYLTEEDGSSNTVYVDDQGSIGIGTTTPKKGLHISEINGMTHLTLEITDTNGYPNDSYSIGVHQNGLLITDNIARKTRLAIDPNGNVGIGTTSPEGNLHISTIDTPATITLESNPSDPNNQYQEPGSYSLNVSDSFQIYNNRTRRSALVITATEKVLTYNDLSVGKNITSRGNITSSGTIIASGDITSQRNIISSGTITASGDITSSGTITATTYACTSDLRYKKNITPIQGALTKVLSLNGVTYNWKRGQFKEKHFNAEKQIGFIAQDVERIIPEVVHTAKDGYKAISYNKITTVLVEAIKEIKRGTDTRISSLQKENDELRERVAALEKAHERIAALELKVKR